MLETVIVFKKLKGLFVFFHDPLDSLHIKKGVDETILAPFPDLGTLYFDVQFIFVVFALNF
jgi:hypothetical protein